MSKDFADCKKRVIDVFLWCLAYLKAQALIKSLGSRSTESEEALMQSIEDTLKLIAPDLMKEAEHD